MDIELLSKMISELVRSHSEVGLPGLGAFVSEFVPASFSDRGYTINPPYKKLTFIPGKTEDESLVDLYATSNGISAQEARAILYHFLEDTRKVLIDKKTVVFPGLGRLRATRQNNFFFITDESLDIYPDGFGLQPLSLKNHEESPAEVHRVVESLADILVVPVDDVPEPQPAPAVEPVDDVPEPQPAPAVEPVDDVPANEPEAPVDLPVQPEPQTQAAAEVPTDAETQIEPALELVEPAEPSQPALQVEPAPEAAQEDPTPEAPAAEPTPEEPAPVKPKRRGSKWIWLTPLLLLALAALVAATFMILVQVSPDFIDTLLYTPEELRIINY